MRSKNMKETSMNLYFRTLRSTYNKAIEANHAKRSNSLFNEFKISKFSIKTEKRAIYKDNIKLILNLDLSKEREYIQFSRDLFIFNYLCGGINFTDMANLKQNNIADGKLSYIRQKTGKKIAITINIDSRKVINILMRM